MKVLTDAGVYGIGEGYGSPGVGIKEGVLELRPYFIGKDPLQIEVLYNGLGTRVDGSAHMLLRAVSAIEIALWDLAGKLLNQPVATLLGGRYRDRVRVYSDEGPRNMLDRASCSRMGRPHEERSRRLDRLQNPAAPLDPQTRQRPRPLQPRCSPPVKSATSGRPSNTAGMRSVGTTI